MRLALAQRPLPAFFGQPARPDHGAGVLRSAPLDIRAAFWYGVVGREDAPAMAVATTRFSGRAFSVPEVTLIREIVRDCSGLSRMELARTVCELLRWRAPERETEGSGSGREFLERLDAGGALVLPDKRQGRATGSVTRVPRTAAGEPGPPLVGSVRDVEPLRVERVREPAERLLFRELVGRYHYLGHTVPFGAHLRYLVFASRPARGGGSGCLQFSSPAWRMAVRDRWIGWGRRNSGAESPARGQQQPLPVAAVGRGEQPRQRRPGARPRAVGGGLGRATTSSSPGSWRRWWIPAATTGVATAPPTGSRWARPAVEVAWTGTAAVPARRPRRSWSILWSEMRSGGCGSVERCEPAAPRTAPPDQAPYAAAEAAFAEAKAYLSSREAPADE